jgi:hypothetical protein
MGPNLDNEQTLERGCVTFEYAQARMKLVIVSESGIDAFRRGLGTSLNEAGADDSEIQSILRHADVSTTAHILYSAESGTGRGGVEETRQNRTHEVRYRRIEAWAPSSMVRAIGS